MNKGQTTSIDPFIQQNPFPGLRPFEECEAHLFFGREREITELLGRVVRRHFLAVLGSSGCGKSSLVKAGLIPSLKYEQLDDGDPAWRIAGMRPGNNPLTQLAIALTREQALGKFGRQTDAAVPIMQMILRRGALGMVEAVRETGLPPEAKLLVLVDQFEELFRFPQRAGSAEALDEAHAFVNLLLEAVNQRDWPIYIVLTMRSEFLGECAAFPCLAEAITNGIYLLPNMKRDQLREVIREPIATHHGQITERLVNRLLNDLGGNTDQLPILQHALMRLWSHWMPQRQEGPMDLEHYQFIGELQGSLSAHAEKIYNEELLTDRERDLAEWLFRSITEMTADNRTVRKPMKLGVICRRYGVTTAEMKPVIERFRAEGCSFLMPPVGVELDEESTIDISHESLIRQWQRLSDWATSEAKEAKLYADLKHDAEAWERRDHDPFWLYTGTRLTEAQAWASLHRSLVDDDPLMQGFLATSAKMQRFASLLLRAEKWMKEGRDESLLLRGRELKEAEQWLAGDSYPSELQPLPPKPEVKMLAGASRRAVQRLRRLQVGLVTAFILLLAVTIIAWNQRGQAKAQELSAQKERLFAQQARDDAIGARDDAIRAREKAEEAQEAARQLAARELTEKIRRLAKANEIDQLNAIKSSIRIVADNKIAFAAYIEEDLGRTDSDRLYKFALIPENRSLKGQSSHIAKVSYILAHHSFKYKLLEGVRDNQFKAGYIGWGCLTEVIAIIEYTDPVKAPSITTFNMCEKLGDRWK